MRLLDLGLVQRVAVLDCDLHYGNGTDDLISRLGLQDRITHHTMSQYFGCEQGVVHHGAHFMAWLQSAHD